MPPGRSSKRDASSHAALIDTLRALPIFESAALASPRRAPEGASGSPTTGPTQDGTRAGSPGGSPAGDHVREGFPGAVEGVGRSPKFTDLVQTRYLAPMEAKWDPSLLTEEFVAAGSADEARLLTSFLGVQKLSMVDFYRCGLHQIRRLTLRRGVKFTTFDVGFTIPPIAAQQRLWRTRYRGHWASFLEGGAVQSILTSVHRPFA